MLGETFAQRDHKRCLRPIPFKAQFLSFIDDTKHFLNSPWFVSVPRRNVGSLERCARQEMIKDLAVILVGILLRVVRQGPSTNVGFERLFILSNDFKIGIVLSLVIDEAIQLKARHALESIIGNVNSRNVLG